MANPVGSGVATTRKTGHGFSTQDLAGMFAFRFSGFAMRNNILHHLVGVGQFTIEVKDGKGTLVGSHKSSRTALSGQAAAIGRGDYALTGEITLEDSGVTGCAKVHFEDLTGQKLHLDGEFYVVAAGSADRLWLVSAADSIPPQSPGQPPVPADEVVSLEAVRIVIA